MEVVSLIKGYGLAFGNALAAEFVIKQSFEEDENSFIISIPK